jgi:hypothetical protein
MRRWNGFAVGAVLLAGGLAVAPEPADPHGSTGAFQQSIDVALVSQRVRIVDLGGSPIRGLVPSDLRVRVGKREIPVVALEWVEEGQEEVSAAPGAGEAATGDATPPSAVAPAPSPSAGRLVVVFVEADLHPSRISGQLRLRPYTRALLAGLQANDRVAVVSFDSHLKLWQDFSDDSVATHAAIDRAMLFSEERPVPEASPVSFAAGFPHAQARARARRPSSSSAGGSVGSTASACT